MFEQFKFLRQDLARWNIRGPKQLFYCLFEGGIWATIFYRLGRMFYLVQVPIAKMIFRVVSFLFFKLSEILFGVSLPPSVCIGPGLHIGHTGLIVVHHAVRMGSNCSIAHGVTLGTAGMGQQGAPVLGNNVFLGSGAKVIGGVVIGNNVRVGANAVVVTDIPDNATAVGVPAKVIKR